MREQINLTEYSKTISPVDLMGTDIQLIQSKFKNKLGLERPMEGSGYHITTSSYVGVYYLDKYQVVVNPKVHISSVFKMLVYAYDLNFFSNTQAHYESIEELFEYLLEIFQKKVHRLIKNGLYSNYIDRTEDLGFVRGRINQTSLITSAWRKERIVCDFDEYDNDIIENQIIKCTLERLIRSSVVRNRTIRNKLDQSSRYFDHLSYRRLTGEDFGKVQYHVLNAHYEPILMFCKMIWELVGIHEKTGSNRFVAYSLDMNLLFEKYIGKLLQVDLEECSVELQTHSYLDIERDYLIRPDIIIKRNSIPVLVVDTKYKKNSSASSGDVMQMYGYMNKYRINGVLLYPRFDIQEKVNRMGDNKMYIKTYDTNNLDESAEELVSWLSSEVVKLLQFDS
jgi:5-methylcytosine-specific restriction enzyme subunit McrC